MTEKKDITNVLKDTHQGVDLANEQKRANYAKHMSGFSGWLSTMFGGLGVNNYKKMVDGKNLINQRKKKF